MNGCGTVLSRPDKGHFYKFVQRLQWIGASTVEPGTVLKKFTS